MATYVNDLRLKEIATGDESGTWGTSTNTNLELIANAMGVGAEAIANASTHTITMSDGTADEFRSTFLRLTGGGTACTVTLAPNTLSHTWIMRNETAAALTLTQGSGANVIIAAGQTKIVATDGAGSGAVVYEMDDLELAGNLAVGSDINLGDDLLMLSDAAAIKFGADSEVILSHVADTGLLLNSTMGLFFNDGSQFINSPNATTLDINATDEIELNATAIDVNGTMDVSGTLGVTSTSTLTGAVGINIAPTSYKLTVNSGATTETTAAAIGYNGDAGTNLYINTDHGNSLVSLYASGSASKEMRFLSGSLEVMRLGTTGNLLVGTTSNINFSGVVASHNFSHTPSNRWVGGFRNATTGTAWGMAIAYSAVSPNNTSSNFLYLSDSSALRCSVMSNGGVQNYQANDLNLSDRREKTNFLPAKSYLDVICAIPVQTFNYIDQNMEEDPSVTLGVVAQDVETVAPELVTESNWGTHEDPKMRLSIYQTDFQYALMKCIQEQQATIEALTQRIEALENN